MSDSMFGSLLNMLDKHTVGEVANALGQPQASVARGYGVVDRRDAGWHSQ